MKKDKQINIRVPQKMYEVLAIKAGLDFKDVSEIIRELIVIWLKKQ